MAKRYTIDPAGLTQKKLAKARGERIRLMQDMKKAIKAKRAAERKARILAQNEHEGSRTGGNRNEKVRRAKLDHAVKMHMNEIKNLVEANKNKRTSKNDPKLKQRKTK